MHCTVFQNSQFSTVISVVIKGVSKLKEGPAKCKPILNGVLYLFWALALTQILLMPDLIAFNWFNHVNLNVLKVKIL